MARGVARIQHAARRRTRHPLPVCKQRVHVAVPGQEPKQEPAMVCDEAVRQRHQGSRSVSKELERHNNPINWLFVRNRTEIELFHVGNLHDINAETFNPETF